MKPFKRLFNILSFAKVGIPYMGVGRNLAYKKSEFFNANGFISHIDVRSGDDDLFINQVATSTNTAICFSKDSFTESIPKTTFSDWIKQKRRHISTAKHYKLKHKVLLTLLYMLPITVLVIGHCTFNTIIPLENCTYFIAFKTICPISCCGFFNKKTG